MTKDAAWKEIATTCRDIVLVCRKCSKKLDGGFGPDGDERLAKALRRSLDAAVGRKVKPRRRAVAVIEVGCLRICPKGAVVTLRADAPGRWLLVPEGVPLPEVMRRLGLPASGAP